MVQDVKELQLLTDPDIHFKLIKFCHNNRLAHLDRNLPPTTMANPACGVQTVDSAVVNEVLAKGTGNRSRSWSQDETNWHRVTVDCPHSRAGLASHPRVLQASLLSSLWHKRFRWMAGAALTRMAPARAMP